MTLAERVAQWPQQWRREGVAEGRREGSAHARLLLQRLTQVRFGTAVARQIEHLLRDTEDWDQLATVAELIVRADTGAHLIDSVVDVTRPRRTPKKPSPRPHRPAAPTSPPQTAPPPSRCAVPKALHLPREGNNRPSRSILRANPSAATLAGNSEPVCLTIGRRRLASSVRRSRRMDMPRRLVISQPRRDGGQAKRHVPRAVPVRAAPVPLGTAVFAAAVLVASACSTPTVAPFPEPVRPPKPLAGEVAAGEEADTTDDAATSRTVSPTPALPPIPTTVDLRVRRMGDDLEGPPIGVSFNDAPLPVFINEVFNERLGLSFHIHPGLREKTDLVTLRLADPVPPAQLFDAARRALRYYGVAIIEEPDGTLTFVAGQQTARGDVPLLVTGRTLPEVPATHREIFQLVPMHVVPMTQVRTMLLRVFDPQALTVELDGALNALLLKGTSAVIARALEIIEVFDQPFFRGQHGIIIEPEFLDARKVANDLINMLKAEGYQVDQTPSDTPKGVLILPLESINKLVAFAADRQTLVHIEEWAEILDQRRQQSVDNALFTYQLQHAQAGELAQTLGELLSAGALVQPAAAAGEVAAPSRARGVAGARVVVEPTRNVILFSGSGREWAQLRGVIEELDKPVPMVMIEAVIAEVSLTDKDGSGIEFLARAALEGGRGVRFGTLDALGIQANALSMTVDSAGNTRALLNLFYEDSRVLIRSRPRVVVGSGEQANFESGNDIPAITQIADSGAQADGNTTLVQQVTYRQTGVTLDITPTAQGNGLVNLDIQVSLSEARPTAATSLTGTPTILQRELRTTLTLRDGGSTVMGGLISDSKSTGNNGIPGLARIPALGRLFRTDTFQQDRTELIIMVIAYVIADHDESRELAERLKAELELHRQFME